MKMMRSRSNQRGFTIVELMIATTVFSVILLLATTMIIGIGRLYYKGISQNRVQTATRTISNEIADHLRYSDQAPVSGSYPHTNGVLTNYHCIGTTRYTYVLHRQMGNDPGQIRHVLWRDNVSGTGCTGSQIDMTASQPSANGVELGITNSRLVAFSITGDTTYDVRVHIAYGDDDLLCDSNNVVRPNDCQDTVDDGPHKAGLAAPGANVICRSNIGQEFCATAHLETTVVRRIVNGTP